MSQLPQYATFEGPTFRGFVTAEVPGLENIKLTTAQAQRVEAARIIHGYKPDTFECWALKDAPGKVRIVK
ncbi:hypothetical protein Q5H93_21615 [Hymenobacter sp. ASUV-10]|uniref:Uncharacterized protein n=1 Tax=Hymenobacter aranciens TaxID=3063996 RepID=A0ABT9BI55_9BACT|nr:hypothetical protein [Hymenobacter sp. ASUV-10]MDO7877358.1 hypothetical protein [Hymenobacter sp. ASUV-10]